MQALEIYNLEEDPYEKIDLAKKLTLERTKWQQVLGQLLPTQKKQ